MTIRRFLTARRGAIAIMGALMMGVLTLGIGGVIEFNNASIKRQKIQRLSDAATLSAAKAYREDEDAEEALELARTIFNNGLRNMEGVAATHDFRIDLDPETLEVSASNLSDITIDTVFAKSLAPQFTMAGITSEVKLSGGGPDLYIVMLIDATGSMRGLINSVKSAAITLESELRAAIVESGSSVGRIFVKVAYFRDLRIRGGRSNWVESPAYDLTGGRDQEAFETFVNSQGAWGGGDWPESSPAALAYALTAPVPEELNPSNTVQLTVLWTDAPGIPLGDADGPHDDITVTLYKKYGPSNYRGASSSYDEDDYLRGPQPNAEYGCCSDFTTLERLWATGGAIPLDNRRLGLRVPTSDYPWPQVAAWRNATASEYRTPHAGGLIDDLVRTLGVQYSRLRVSR